MLSTPVFLPESQPSPKAWITAVVPQPSSQLYGCSPHSNPDIAVGRQVAVCTKRFMTPPWMKASWRCHDALPAPQESCPCFRIDFRLCISLLCSKLSRVHCQVLRCPSSLPLECQFLGEVVLDSRCHSNHITMAAIFFLDSKAGIPCYLPELSAGCWVTVFAFHFSSSAQTSPVRSQ